MDHIGVKARAESVKLIMKKINELPKSMPVILSGDFNVDQYNESYYLLNDSDILNDSYVLSDIVYEPNGTFNNFDANNKSDSRIDHIFLTKEFKVNKYGILTDTYRAKSKDNDKYIARVPSDHFPVVINVEIIK